MIETTSSPDRLSPATSPPPAPRRRTDFWAIVLAGGEGVRLRPLVRRALGEERPKQYVPLLSGRTLLGQTLDRIGLGIPVDRTLVVTMEQHAGYLVAELSGEAAPHVLAQPADRGTAAAILAAVRRISHIDPAATVAVFPSDHYIPSEATFMAYVAEIGTWTDAHPERIVLLGAHATSPEVEYGWIEPGDVLGQVTTGAVRAVRQFWEKPSLSRARMCLRAGHLWNTSVVVGRAEAFLHAGELGAPDIVDALTRADDVVGSERDRLSWAFDRMAKANFSRAVLEACPEALAVARLPRLVWSDLGSPRRVIEVMERLGVRPDWADKLSAQA
jgi:mannose-1-phosphate guanylyltransferase